MNNKGFTLIEMLITMALVIVVIMITSSAFTSILKSTSRLTASEDSNIEGVVGLEIFRRDLQQAGFGLYDSITNYDSSIAYYTEAAVSPADGLNDNTLASQDIPRALVSFNNISGASDSTSQAGTTFNILNHTDYLGIKATTVGGNKASQKWTYVTYSSSGKAPYVWQNPSENLANDDRAIVISRTFSSLGTVNNTLITPPATPNIYWIANATTTLSSIFNPTNANQINYIYGIRGYDTSTTSDLGMPFNRADYFVARPSNSSKIPSMCAPNSGILYRANINHTDGKLSYMPLIDCVADMQVVFGWDANGNGVIDESSAYDADSAKIAVSTSISTSPEIIKNFMTSPAEVRNKLKYIKVYLMVQEGRKDVGYANSASINVGDTGNLSLTKTYSVADLTTNGWLNYRWKIYRIVVRPKNLTN
ncbi:MAG: PilW family protein [Desulfuromonadaceae bacterium]|nr:PilW family protein [Desulfuromonadaceae bacterium]